MDIRSIKYFLVAAEYLNFTKAAKECYITQTAMSQNISSIEKELGFKLFERNNRNVQLTAAGHNFYEQMKLMLHNYDNAVKQSRHISDGNQGKLSIVFPSWIEGMLFIPRLKHFKKIYPDITLSVSMAPPQQIPELLLNGDCDVATGWPQEFEHLDEISIQNIAEFKGNLICSPSHPLASRGKVTLEDLAREHLVIVNFENMPEAYHMVCQEWKKHGLQTPNPADVEHISHIEDLYLTICMEDSVALVPEFMKYHITNGLTFLKLDMHNPITFKMCSAHLEKITNPAVPNLLDVLHDKRIPLNY